MKGTDVLITGGYGTVGRRVGSRARLPGRVVVAGRSAEKAAQLSAELGHGVGRGQGNGTEIGAAAVVRACRG